MESLRNKKQKVWYVLVTALTIINCIIFLLVSKKLTGFVMEVIDVLVIELITFDMVLQPLIVALVSRCANVQAFMRYVRK